MIILKPYQIEAVNAIKETFSNEFRQYIEMPTGSGKTITFLHYAAHNHDSILIIVSSIHLMNQVYDTALLFYKKQHISRKGDRYNDKISKVHICVINSLKGDYLEFLSYEKFDFLIIDEAHHAQSASYKRVLKKLTVFQNKNIFVLGVTATPDRLDAKLLDEILYKKSFKLELADLISADYLSDIEGYVVKTNLDLSSVDHHNGDYSINKLYNHLNIDFRNNLIYNSYIKYCKDRKTLIFCINIAHSKHICKLFKSHGISCSHIDGKMSQEERKLVLDNFKNGTISVLCNCSLLIEGFDEPSIDGIILSRPTKSRALYLQMIGRGLRKHPSKKNCVIIDIADSHSSVKSLSTIINYDVNHNITTFKSLSDLKEQVRKLELDSIETTIQKIKLYEFKKISDENATASMLEYLISNKIFFIEPISFDEASFLIWFNKLKKDYKENGINY